MEIYIAGVLVVFLINLGKLFVAVIASSSQKNKNIEKLGLHYNIIEGHCTKQKPTWGKVTFHLFDLLVIAPLLSWVNVCYFAFSLVKKRVNKAPLPEKLKEINYKLSTVNLPRETVKDYINEIARFYGGEDAGIDERSLYDDEYDKNRYVISSGDIMHDSNVHLELDKKNHSFRIIARDPSPTFVKHIATYEYKFNASELWSRTIEKKRKYPGSNELEYDIKNGVFLEQEFRDRQKSLSSDVQKIIFMVEGIEERILKLRAETNWSDNVNPAIRYFILFRHNDLLDNREAKRFFQAEHERLLSGFKKLEEKVKHLGCSIGKSEFIEGNEIKCEPNGISEECLAEIREILTDKSLVRYGIKYGEFRDYEPLIQDIELYLSRL